MSRKLRSLAWLLLLVWLVPALALAQRKGRLVGKVVDPDEKPLQGVTVTVTSPQITSFRAVEVTDKKGVFSVDFKQVDVTYHYRFDMPGFQSMEVDQHWSLEGTQFYEWKMKPGQSAAVPPAGNVAPASASEAAVEAYNTGFKAFKAKDYTTAESKLKEAVDADPNLRQAWAVLSATQLELDKNKEAAEAAEKAIALGATDEAVLLSRWQAYRKLGDDAKTADALKALEKAGRAAEEAKKIHNEGVALLKAKDYAGAFAKFQEALNVNPNLQPSLLGLAESGVKCGHNAEAAAAAEAVLKDDPKNEQAIRLRFNACLGLGDKARLIDALIGLAPYEPKIARDGLLQLAFDAYDANDMPTARDRFLKVIQVDPDQREAHYYLGIILMNLGASEDAKSHLERFLQLAPNDKEAASAREMLKYLSKP